MNIQWAVAVIFMTVSSITTETLNLWTPWKNSRASCNIYPESLDVQQHPDVTEGP